jgi:hypothetical protein
MPSDYLRPTDKRLTEYLFWAAARNVWSDCLIKRSHMTLWNQGSSEQINSTLNHHEYARPVVTYTCPLWLEINLSFLQKLQISYDTFPGKVINIKLSSRVQNAHFSIKISTMGEVVDDINAKEVEKISNYNIVAYRPLARQRPAEL